MINTENFFYTGIDGGFGEGKAFKKFQETAKPIVNEIKSQKELTAEDC